MPGSPVPAGPRYAAPAVSICPGSLSIPEQLLWNHKWAGRLFCIFGRPGWTKLGIALGRRITHRKSFRASRDGHGEPDRDGIPVATKEKLAPGVPEVLSSGLGSPFGDSPRRGSNLSERGWLKPVCRTASRAGTPPVGKRTAAHQRNKAGSQSRTPRASGRSQGFSHTDRNWEQVPDSPAVAVPELTAGCPRTVSGMDAGRF